MLDRFKSFWQGVMLAPFVNLFIRLGISPDAVTLVGTAGVAAGALIFFPQGKLLVGEADVAALDLALMRFTLEGVLRLHLEPLPVGSARDPMPRSFAPARAAVLQREEVVADLGERRGQLGGTGHRAGSSPGSAPWTMGTRTAEPHSVQEPS